MDATARHALGAHYTTEQNILKVITGLFLDDLRAEFEVSRNSARKLRALHDRLAEMTFFDPAAGSGNFLVIAYREVRKLEFDILVRLDELDKSGGQQHLSIDAISGLSKVNVDQFYAIEIEEFPARIAETALYLVDHLENMRLSRHFDQYFARIPLRAEAHIYIDNAIRLDWNDVLSSGRCTYILGNPPFLGHSRTTKSQQDDNRIAFRPIPWATRTGRLDYVASWYAKALRYMKGTKIRAAFVSTNSITQGEQARTMGPMLAQADFEIDFAHRTFKWTSEARGKAAVHVIIVGFSEGGLAKTKTIYDYPHPTGQPKAVPAKHINVYLADGPDVVPAKRRDPLVPGLPKCYKGSQPTDGGHLIVEPADLAVVAAEPIAAKYLRRLVGAHDMLRDEWRGCLWMVNASPGDLAKSGTIKRRLVGVRDARLKSQAASVREDANIPSLFTQIRQPRSHWLCIPRHSSEGRQFVPMAFFSPQDIAHDSVLVVEGADDYLFGILQSSAYMA
jgi:hypothetical protein